MNIENEGPINSLKSFLIRFAWLAGIALSLATALPARAAYETSYLYAIAATLSGAQEVPPNGSPASGTAKGNYAATTNQLTVTIAVNGLSTSQLAASHIHLGAAGTSGAVIVDLGTAGWTNTASGMTLTTTVSVPDANELDLTRGNTYFNLHTAAFPGGEIRGQIRVTAAVVQINNAAAYDVSADGSVVVGQTAQGDAFRWTAAGGVQSLGYPANAAQICNTDEGVCTFSSKATGVSADGNVIGGEAYVNDGTSDTVEAFRWTAETGWQGLGKLVGASYAYAISDDGSTIVGGSGPNAYRWTASSGMVALPRLNESWTATAYATSADGAATVGFNAGAVIWQASGAARYLGGLPGSTVYNGAYGVTPDGATAVGYSDSGSSTPFLATKWTSAGLVTLDLLPYGADGSWATDVSADGGRIVGITRYGGNPFVWSAHANKGRLLAHILADAGINLDVQNYSSIRPAISRDGSTVVTNHSGRTVIAYLGSTLDPVAPSVDLGLSMSATPDPVAQGGTLTYRLTVSNAGPSVATGVGLTDTLPAGVSFVSAIPSQGSCVGSVVISCTPGDLASGASATVQITVTPTVTGTLNNSAAVTSNEGDANTANNSASTSVTVGAPAPSADVSVTMSDSPDPVKRLGNLTYAINVKNSGPGSAESVTLKDALPLGMRFVSATSSQGSCSGTSTVTCKLGILASGGNASVTLVVQPRLLGTYTNKVSVSSTTLDNSTGNNSATVATKVN